MAFSLEKYKKNQAKNAEALSAQLDRINPEKKSTKFQSDDRFWYPKRDKAGNGKAVIRFLDAPEGEEVPCIRYWRHSFQGPTGGWYIENSLTTFEKPDPVSEYNSELWNSGRKDEAVKQKRKLVFVANVFIVNDYASPENNGKVFLFKFGKKIYNKINSLMFPEFPEDPRVNPFDLLEGADFRLVINKEDGWPSYNDSTFAPPGPISFAGKPLTEKEIGQVVAAQHSLQELLSDEHFKTYDELKARLNKVLGLDGRKVSVTAPVADKPKAAALPPMEDDDDDDIDPKFFDKLTEGE